MPLKKLFLIGLICFAAPVSAQDDAEGKSLMQQGAEMFLRGLTEQMEPALEDLKDLTEDMGPQMLEFFSEMGPSLGALMDEIEDWSLYEAPEVLPNGDIIIRRKPDRETEENPDENPDGTIDL